MVELVVTIVILGVLAATALPKFYNFGTDARIAVLHSLSGSIQSTVNLFRHKCVLDTNGCNLNARMTSLTYGGTTYGMNYGWIGAGFNSPGLIDSAMQNAGFRITYSNPFTTFELPSAPDPRTCSVSYGNAWATGDYSISVNTSGC